MQVTGTIDLNQKNGLYRVMIPQLGIWTQCEKIDDGLLVAQNMIKALISDLEFSLRWSNKAKGEFILESNDSKINEIIKRERHFKKIAEQSDLL